MLHDDEIKYIAEGAYQEDVLAGRAPISGYGLKGKAAKYASRYYRSRLALCKRLRELDVPAVVLRHKLRRKLVLVTGADVAEVEYHGTRAGEYLGLPLYNEWEGQ